MIQIKYHEGVLEAPLTKKDIFPIKFTMNKMYFLLKLKKIMDRKLLRFFKEIASSNASHFTFPVQNKHIPAPSQKSSTLTFFASSCTDLDK